MQGECEFGGWGVNIKQGKVTNRAVAETFWVGVCGSGVKVVPRNQPMATGINLRASLLGALANDSGTFAPFKTTSRGSWFVRGPIRGCFKILWSFIFCEKKTVLASIWR